MAWDDWVFGALTGGLYNVGKTAYKAGKAADKAGDAIEEISDGAGTALAAVGSTVTKLGKDMSSFLKEMEELLTVRRLTPRDEDDLWDEEVERLEALRQRESELLAELAALGKSDDDRSWTDSFWGAIFGGVPYEELAIRTKLAVVRKAINEILYEEPGVVPASIYSLQQILERFNTLEQPRLEDILDSANDNLEESKEIMEEVKKLFVVRTWKAVAVGELSEGKRAELATLEASFANLDKLVEKNRAVSKQLQDALVKAQPAKFQMAKMIGFKMPSSGEEESTDSDNPGGNPGGNPGDSGGDRRSLGGRPGIEATHVAGAASALHAVLPGGPSLALKGKGSVMAMQPMAASVATALNQNAVAAYMDNYQTVEGRLRYHLREKLKVEKAIYRIKWVPVDEPGVISKMLEEIREVIERFRRESQPRLETLLDGVNATVLESKEMLSNINLQLEKSRGMMEFLERHSLLVKIGLALFGGLVVFILVLLVIVLLRLALAI
jgi:hypothetical protein